LKRQLAQFGEVAATSFALILLLAGAAGAQTDPWKQALKLFQAKLWSESAAAFQTIEAGSPGQTDALLFVGRSLINLNRFRDAEKELESYVAAHKQSDEALYLLAFVKFRENQPAESLRLSTEAAKLKPPRADDLKIVAMDYVLLNDLASATRYLEEALKMEPGNLEARYALGRVLYQQNFFDRSIAAFQEVLRADPRNLKAQDNLGLAFEGKNEVEQAIVAYRKAIALDSELPKHDEQPYLNLGMLLTKSGKADAGVQLLIRAAEISPESSKPHLELGKAYLALGKLPEARRELETAVKIRPDASSIHYLLGRLYQRMKDTQLAAKEFQRTDELIRAKQEKAGAMGGGMQSPEDE
jgi:tetratricopeptide (TPR) repeat protein